MSNDISKAQLLVYFKKINAYNYICKKCNKPYKTPNGGIGNLKAHYATHLQDVSDKVVPGKRKSQTVLPCDTDVVNADEPQTIDVVSVSIFFLLYS